MGVEGAPMGEHRFEFVAYETVGMAPIDYAPMRDYDLGGGLHVYVPQHLWEQFDAALQSDDAVAMGALLEDAQVMTRGQWLVRKLRAALQDSGYLTRLDNPGQIVEDLAALITQVHHLCDDEGLAFGQVLNRAYEMYAANVPLKVREIRRDASLKWKRQEFLGAEVQDLDGKRLPAEHSALQVGLVVVFHWTMGMLRAKVVSVVGEWADAEIVDGHGLSATLQFGGDDRGRWVCVGLGVGDCPGTAQKGTSDGR